MANIIIKKGDATLVTPSKSNGVIIAHIVNRVGAWGGGFVLALSKMSPIPRAAYMAWIDQYDKQGLPLGETQFVEANEGRFVANMCAQIDVGSANPNEPLIDYKAFERCVRTTFHRALRLQYDVHMPAGIGSGLAGGDRTRIHQIIEESAKHVEDTNSLVKAIKQLRRQDPLPPDVLGLSITLWEFEDSKAASFVPNKKVIVAKKVVDVDDDIANFG